MASPGPTILQRLSLSARILLPFFCILITLSAVATVGSIVLIRQSLQQTVDERLLAAQEVIYREIKKQELLLDNYANLLVAFHGSNNNDAIALTLQDQLYASLSRGKITTTIYPAAAIEHLPYPSLRELFLQAGNSGKARFRYTGDLGPTPSLSVATPIPGNGSTPAILLLQTAMDRTFLRRLSEPFHATGYLLDSSGNSIVSSATEVDSNPPHLTTVELQQVLSGGRLFVSTGEETANRYLVSAVPLGNSDMLLLAVEIPTSHLDLLLRTMATRAALTITFALIFGGLLYAALIRQIMAPLKELLRATSAVGNGNLAYRIGKSGAGELGQLADSFNHMVSDLENLYQKKIEQEKHFTQVQDELRFKEVLEQKNLEIEDANRELKVHIREVSALFQLNQTMISTLDLSTLFDRTLNLLKDLVLTREMVLLLYNQGSGELEVRKSVGIDAEALGGVTFHLNEGVSGEAARTKELQYVRDVTKDSRYLHYKGKAPARGSMVSAPIVFKNQLIGTLNLHKERPNAFTDTELKLIRAACNQLAIAIENAQLYEKARTLSNTDELTNLANRRHFHEILKRELAHASRFASNFCLLMIDIDHFKQFNDTHGHLGGDVVLRRVATLLLQNTRGIDLVARFGGEEFVVLLPKTNKDGAKAAAEKLRLCIAEERIALGGTGPETYCVTVSIGVAEYPRDSRDIYELLDFADRALYLAKQAGRNRTVVWEGIHHHPAPPTAPSVQD